MTDVPPKEKDLTDILKLSQEMMDSITHSPDGSAPENLFMEETPIEKLDSFESLESLPLSPVIEEAQPALMSSDTGSPQNDASAFETSPVSSDEALSSDVAFDALAATPTAEAPQSPVEFLDPPAVSLDSGVPPDSPAIESPSSSVLNEVKKYSESLTVGTPTVAAEFPFSLLITGPLKPEEKDKLLDLLSRHQMGIREIDLEPQWVSQRILIPRISEYAGILLVQALRGCRAQIQLGPSDTIFSTPETRSDTEIHTQQKHEFTLSTDSTHPAELIPVTSQSKLPDLPHFIVIDSLTASATLKSRIVEAENSSEYQEILESLQRELKYKAYRKKAIAILDFKIQLTSLSSPTHYSILVSGTAIRPKDTDFSKI